MSSRSARAGLRLGPSDSGPLAAPDSPGGIRRVIYQFRKKSLLVELLSAHRQGAQKAPFLQGDNLKGFQCLNILFFVLCISGKKQ